VTERPAGDAPYRLRSTPTVRRALGETVPEAAAIAAYEFMTGPVLRQPYRVGKRLLPPLDDRFSARRGTYRIIYRVDDKSRVVTVVDVVHRRDACRT
jgi:mRNA interferase RelE/StbE